MARNSGEGLLTASGSFFPVSGTPGGVVDNTAAVQSAIDAAAAAGGGIVTFGLGVYGLASDVVISTPGVVLQGAFTLSGIYQGAPTAGTVLKRIGATAGDVLRYATPAAAATAISGNGLQNIAIDGNNVAATGLHLRSVQWSSFVDLHIRNCVTQLASLDVETTIVDGVCVNQGCIFERISGTQVVSTNGHGFVLDGTAPFGNTSINTFNRLSIRHVNGTAFRLLNCDSNTFIMCSAPRTGGGTGVGLEFNGSMTAGVGHARANTFIAFDAGPGGCVSRGAGLTQPAVHNWILPYSVENSAGLQPVIEAGSTLYLLDDLGTATLGQIVLLASNAAIPIIAPIVGSPEGNLTAPIGSVAIRVDSNARGSLQIKDSGVGNTGWKPAHVETTASVSANVATLAQATTLMDATGGARTATLPTAVGISGKVFRLKKVDASANTVTLLTTAAQTIEGAANVVLAAQWAFVEVQSDGANWVKI